MMLTLRIPPGATHACYGKLVDAAGRPHDLDKVMEWGTAIRVRIEGDQTFVDTGVRDRTVPDLLAFSYPDGSHLPGTDTDLQDQAQAYGWDGLLTGFTGQYGYGGPCMHASEFVGGGLADHILTTPGLYAVTEISEDDGEPESWAIAYKAAE